MKVARKEIPIKSLREHEKAALTAFDDFAKLGLEALLAEMDDSPVTQEETDLAGTDMRKSVEDPIEQTRDRIEELRMVARSTDRQLFVTAVTGSPDALTEEMKLHLLSLGQRLEGKRGEATSLLRKSIRDRKMVTQMVEESTDVRSLSRLHKAATERIKIRERKTQLVQELVTPILSGLEQTIDAGFIWDTSNSAS